jgi:hypothetical protein
MIAKAVKKLGCAARSGQTSRVAKRRSATAGYPEHNWWFEQMLNVASPPAGRLKTHFDRRCNVNSDQ